MKKFYYQYMNEYYFDIQTMALYYIQTMFVQMIDNAHKI